MSEAGIQVTMWLNKNKSQTKHRSELPLFPSPYLAQIIV
jgi:hypothetical protein